MTRAVADEALAAAARETHRDERAAQVVNADAPSLGRRAEQLRPLAHEADLQEMRAQHVCHAVWTVRSPARVHEHRIGGLRVLAEALAIRA